MPLNGRPIRETHQGKVSEALALYRSYGGFGPAKTAVAQNLTCEMRKNGDGEVLDFCLFPGGHSFSTKHLAYGIQRLKDAGQL